MQYNDRRFMLFLFLAGITMLILLWLMSTSVVKAGDYTPDCLLVTGGNMRSNEVVVTYYTAPYQSNTYIYLECSYRAAVVTGTLKSFCQSIVPVGLIYLDKKPHANRPACVFGFTYTYPVQFWED